jgi:hypothetical protein
MNTLASTVCTKSRASSRSPVSTAAYRSSAGSRVATNSSNVISRPLAGPPAVRHDPRPGRCVAPHDPDLTLYRPARAR